MLVAQPATRLFYYYIVIGKGAAAVLEGTWVEAPAFDVEALRFFKFLKKFILTYMFVADQLIQMLLFV